MKIISIVLLLVLFFALGGMFQDLVINKPQLEQLQSKVDYIYDAREFYQRALEINPDNLETLLKYRQNCVRFNDEEKIREIDRKVAALISPQDIAMSVKSNQVGAAASHSVGFITIHMRVCGSCKDYIIGVDFFNKYGTFTDHIGQGQKPEY